MERAVWVYLVVQWVISSATAEREKRGEKREKGVCLRENLYLGLISHAQAEWRIFLLYRSLCQILPTHGRPRGTLRTYASPRFAFQPTSLQRLHPLPAGFFV